MGDSFSTSTARESNSKVAPDYREGFLGGSVGKEILTAMQETQVQSLGREDLLEKEMTTTPIFLPGESHGQRSLSGYSPRGCKESDTRLSD